MENLSLSIFTPKRLTMKWFFSAALTIAGLSALALYFSDKHTIPLIAPAAFNAKKIERNTDGHYEEIQRLKVFGGDIKLFARKENYNTRYCFLVDMKRPSGSARFFVYDMKKDSILEEGLVAHGCGTVQNGDNIQFSNKSNSYCTSLGKYKIGNPYNGKFGLAYKLYGLDKTNDQAFNRSVVLHAHPSIPVEETTEPIWQSWGCPTVAPTYLAKLTKYIDNADKPILLWIFN